MMNAQIELLLRMLDDAYDHPAWHGPNLRAAVHGLKPTQVLWRPQPKRHCIADITVHCAYWKYVARRRLRGDKRGSFPLRGSNWFRLPPALTAAEWKGYLALLEEQHQRLRETVTDLSSAQLHKVPKGAKIDNAKLIYGIAAHDLYHAGQIRWLKSLQK